MTSQEIRTAIEQGPLASELSPFWADVFAAEDEPAAVEHPGEREPGLDREELREWAAKVAAHADYLRFHRIKHRAGHLKPDAAFEIHRRLNAGGVKIPRYEDVQAAKVC